MKKILIPLIFSLLSLFALFFYQGEQLSDKKLHLIFCDVGQGDGILIRTPTGADIVIDAGPKNGKMLECLAKYLPFWDRDIELVFATHPDADHIGGLIDVLQSYRVISFNTVTMSKDTSVFRTLQAIIKDKKIPYQEIVTGDSFTLSDGVSLETLWPARLASESVAGRPALDSNEYSLVQLIKYGDFQALATGDITYQILNTLEFHGSFRIFKLPHHGSKTGVDSSSFEKIQTYFAVISAGKNNKYHHPHPSVITLLKKFHVPYLRTDETGSIEVVTDGKNTRVVNN